VGPRAGMEAVAKRKIPSPCRESNPGHPAPSLVATLSYPCFPQIHVKHMTKEEEQNSGLITQLRTGTKHPYSTTVRRIGLLNQLLKFNCRAQRSTSGSSG